MNHIQRYFFLVLLGLLCACASSLSSGPDLEQVEPSQTIPHKSTTPVLEIETHISSLTPSTTYTTTNSLSPISIMAVGDIMLARTIGERILNEGPGIVFANVQTILTTADILAGNMECAITDKGEAVFKNYTLAAPPISAKALGMAGFDIGILGNNHSLDFGQDGLTQTIQLLSEQGIAPLGVGMGDKAPGPLIIEKNGIKIAFLSYVDVPLEISQFDAHAWISTDSQMGIAWAIVEDIRDNVRSAKEQAQVVIVFMHFGYENSDIPVGIQRDVAIAAIDAGATAVIGSHPHILQHVEEYHGGLIAYSLGNFVFDGYGKPQNRSAILELLVDGSGLINYKWHPVVLVEGFPVPASKEQSIEILQMLAP